MSVSSVCLVVGASSAIAQALIKELLEINNSVAIIAITRRVTDVLLKSSRVTYIECDNSESNIDWILNSEYFKHLVIGDVFIFNGILHGKHGHASLLPEKSIRDFEQDPFLEVLKVNTLIPALWLKHLQKKIMRYSTGNIVVLSARVGSIDDNRLGGWYSYRASKAALNMFLKSFAVELNRKAPKVKIIAFHPGTTDTPLSKPFQFRVDPEKLFSPQFVASQLLLQVHAIEPTGEALFIDYQGNPIAW